MKKFRAILALLLAGCMVFGMAACSLQPSTEGDGTQIGGGSEDETQQPGGNGDETEQPGGEGETQQPGDDEGETEQPGDDETQEPGDVPAESSVFWEDVLDALSQEDYVSLEGELVGSNVLEDGSVQEASTVDLDIRLAKDAQYGYDILANAVTDGDPEEVRIVDGIRYDKFSKSDKWYYVTDVSGQIAPISAIAERLLGRDATLVRLCSGLLTAIGPERTEGVEERIAQENGSTVYTLDFRLEEARASIAAWLQSLKEKPLTDLQATVNALLDEDITVAEFLDALSAALAAEGIALEDLCNDTIVATALLFVFANSFPSAAELERLYTDTAQYVADTLAQLAGPQFGSLFSDPKEGETALAYLRRIFGQFKVTGIIDMFAGEGEGARGFARMREAFSEWAQGKSYYDLYNEVFNRMVYPNSAPSFGIYGGYTVDIAEVVASIDFHESEFSLSVVLGQDGRMASLSGFVLWSVSDVDPDDGINVYEQNIRVDAEGTFSYDAFTVEAPSADQIRPEADFASPVYNADGTVFIPVMWTALSPEDVAASDSLWMSVYDADGDLIGDAHFEGDEKIFQIEVTEDGIIVRPTSELDALCEEMATTLPGGVLRIEVTLGLFLAVSAQEVIYLNGISFDYEIPSN